MNGDPLFCGRLNRKDQVPPGRKRSPGFYFEGRYPDQAEDEFPRQKTEFRATQRRLLDELDDAEDMERDETVEGDDILQVLLRANRPRVGRRRYADSVTEDQPPSFVRELGEVLPSYVKGEGATCIHKAERRDEDSEKSVAEASSAHWLPMAHWVGTLLVGISIVLTWPIGLAYFRG